MADGKNIEILGEGLRHYLNFDQNSEIFEGVVYFLKIRFDFCLRPQDAQISHFRNGAFITFPYFADLGTILS